MAADSRNSSKGPWSRLRDKSPGCWLPPFLALFQRNVSVCPRVRACSRVQRESDRTSPTACVYIYIYMCTMYTCWFIGSYTRDKPAFATPQGSNGFVRLDMSLTTTLLFGSTRRRKLRYVRVEKVLLRSYLRSNNFTKIRRRSVIRWLVIEKGVFLTFLTSIILREVKFPFINLSYNLSYAFIFISPFLKRVYFSFLNSKVIWKG